MTSAGETSIGVCAYDLSASDLVELARQADRAGFESLWLGEHVALPVGYSSSHPTAGTAAHERRTSPIVEPDTRLTDPLVALAACAAATERIRLATGIYLLPLRHPLLSGRMAHTLQDVSGGRFLLGLGAGWLTEEFDALDVPFAERYGRLVESIAYMRAAWQGGPFDFEGRYYRAQQLQLCSDPVRVPLILGGNTDAALDRAARLGDGWFSSATPSLDDACRYRDQLLDRRAAHGRHGEFEVYVRIAKPDPETVEAYRVEGFDHLVVWADQLWPAHGTVEEKQVGLSLIASDLGLRAREESPK
ncbi:MAG TPA: TIGR03619 family F420-dependent LLM class oxidoreductase [Acidimicrobiales bacterium]